MSKIIYADRILKKPKKVKKIKAKKWFNPKEWGRIW